MSLMTMLMNVDVDVATTDATTTTIVYAIPAPTTTQIRCIRCLDALAISVAVCMYICKEV